MSWLRALHRRLIGFFAVLLREHTSPGRVALGIVVGCMVGCTPLFGLHLPVCIGLALLLRLNQVVVYGAANVSIPPLVPFLGLAAVQTGEVLLHGHALRLHRADFHRGALPALAGRFFFSWLVGGLVVGAGLGLVGAGIFYALRRARTGAAPAAGRTAMEQALDRARVRYQSAPPRFRYYAGAKYRMDPCYRAICALVPPGAFVVDLGTGLGMLPVVLAELGQGRRALGVDWDRDRVAAGQAAAAGLPVELVHGDIRDTAVPACDVVTLVDVLHYYDAVGQRALLERAAAALGPGGMLLVRDGDGERRGAARWTRALERVLVRLGWNRGPQVRFRPASELVADLAALGLVAERADVAGALHPGNVLLKAQRAVWGMAPDGRTGDSAACYPVQSHSEEMPMQHDDIQQVTSVLRAHGQAHLLHGLSDLDPATRAAFLARLAEVDWDELAHPAAAPAQEEVHGSRVVTLDEVQERRGELSPPGEAAYAAGQVAVLMVAGGQGTRLGSSEPKGCFPIGPLSGKTLYQIQTEKVLALSRRVGRTVPFLIMTSPATDQATRAYFAAHDEFGLAPEQLRVFSQGTVPSLDLTGRALLAAPGKLQENPDGHGGCFTALWRSGQLVRLGHEGVTQIVYIQVDNLLAPVDDPVLVGLAAAERTCVITKVLKKADPDERVGHLVRVGGRDRIIEYTELTSAQVRLRGPDGQMIYRWGSPAMHCFAVRFLLDLGRGGFKVPLHRSQKPVNAWIDGRVQEVQGWKSERFIFDLLPAAQTSLGLEVERAAEFAPIKNQSGADSPQTAVALAEQLYAEWLAGVGVQVDPCAHVEISPLYAATEADLRRRWQAPFSEVHGDLYLSAREGPKAGSQ